MAAADNSAGDLADVMRRAAAAHGAYEKRIPPPAGGAEGCSPKTVIWHPECIERGFKNRQPGMEHPALL